MEKDKKSLKYEYETERDKEPKSTNFKRSWGTEIDVKRKYNYNSFLGCTHMLFMLFIAFKWLFYYVASFAFFFLFKFETIF